ncbi:MAG: D-tyrosyl-tRNA(Tyr) deacylase [bacterium]|nr:D-tyrosyl-tRNA(Tyr) deacylase [Candidatus Kapabacteria bacterium]
MKAVVQRVRNASVTVNGDIVGAIERGALILLGVAADDSTEQAKMLARKIAHLRFFPDDAGVPNLSLVDTGFGSLVVSQFTLLGDARRGNRPSYVAAAPPELAERLYLEFVESLRSHVAGPVATGRFRAMMDVASVNEGPFTLLVESKI